ncbi:MAG: O-acetylhomoserine aminocarboxypropyltransferase/cysteine synthase [Chloroflexi bacterium]|nr:O-acetylhomoserine aminocarboxypropyltransferase/cysteine synthase [Chloroflexota bacterium]
MSEKPLGFDTRAIHAGYAPDTDAHARVVPIYQTTAYEFDSTDHAARLFALQETGNIYTRLMNPTTDVLEKRVSALEGGVAGLAFSSGMAAITAVVEALCQTGDEVVASTRLYGGTVTLLGPTMARRGITTHWVDSDDAATFAAAITDRTKLVYLETIGNPNLTIPDISDIAEAVHAKGVPVVIDNTTASPALCRPLEHGADIVIHSTTKYLNGHGNSLGGVVVDGGKFNWDDGRFPEMIEPDEAYHGVRYVEAYGPAALAQRVRVRVLRDTGATQSPFNAFLTLLGVETLSLRMQRHSENALAVAKYLSAHPKVGWVLYPALESHPSHANAIKYLCGGASGMIGFGIKGGIEAGGRFINNLQLLGHVANIGDARSLAIHPASTTHQQLTPEEQEHAGVTPDFVRLSIGLETIDDILADIDQALG